MLNSDATWPSVVIIEENNEEQGNSTPQVSEVEYSTVLSLTVSDRRHTQMCVCNV